MAVGVLSPELNGIIYKRRCKEQLEDMPSEELEELFKDIFKKNKGRTINVSRLGINDDIFIAAGAYDVLRGRYGDDYALKLVGLRQPKTLGEKLKYWITGQRSEYK